MIASPLYYQKPSGKKAVPTFLKYVTQRSLAVAMFVAVALLASVGNKPSDKGKPERSNSFSISQSRDQQPYLSLNPGQLFDNIVGAIKDAFNDPELIEYANEQGADITDSPIASDQAASGKGTTKDFRNKSALNR